MKNRIGWLTVLMAVALVVGLMLPGVGECRGGKVFSDYNGQTYWTTTPSVLDTLDDKLDVLDALIDSSNGHRSYTVRTSTTAWTPTKGPVTNATASCISLTGMWRIEALGAVAVTAGSGTATNLLFACGQAGGTGVALTGTNAIASDAIGTAYVATITDSTIATIKECTALATTLVHTVGSLNTGSFWVTPATGTLVICDSTSATNTGTRYLWIRATPLTPGATITAN